MDINLILVIMEADKEEVKSEEKTVQKEGEEVEKESKGTTHPRKLEMLHQFLEEKKKKQ